MTHILHLDAAEERGGLGQIISRTYHINKVQQRVAGDATRAGRAAPMESLGAAVQRPPPARKVRHQLAVHSSPPGRSRPIYRALAMHGWGQEKARGASVQRQPLVVVAWCESAEVSEEKARNAVARVSELRERAKGHGRCTVCVLPSAA